MEEYKTLIEQAYKEAKLADYMAYVTSKLVKDKKLLISIIDHINKSFYLALNAYLIKERLYRRVPPVPKEHELLIEMFFQNCAQNLKVEKGLKDTMLKINKAVNAYNERGMLLQRATKYVFVASNYELIDLKIDEVKEYLKKNLEFVNVIKEGLNA
ncbi:MAG: hypothetical protein JW791_01600 [Nanoarchaeota archaeon]|nr:hypothetical protein [Nanoarchaeota archaeon]